MRRHDARKWLHAILDLLPVILIPVFMIYSHRHTIDIYEITRDKYQVVDFNQQVKNGNFVNTSSWGAIGGGSLTASNNIGYFIADSSISSSARIQQNFNTLDGHKYLIRETIKSPVNNLITIGIGGNSSYYTISVNANEEKTIETIINQIGNGTALYLYNNSNQNLTDGQTVEYQNVNIFDLTQMFGIGNEPTIEEFNTMYPNDFYDYNLTEKELVQYGTETFNNTDIGSQFIYSLYNSVDKYFNMGNVFNMHGVYNWLQFNIFNGTAPVSMFIVWNIVLYEFVMDLLMLLYALFMWFIDFCQDLIDRCFTTSKGGKH